MQAPPDPLQLYLETEASAEVKHEFWYDTPVALAGASVAHNRLTFDTARAIDQRMGASPCEVFVADQRVHLGRAYVYPDVVALCDEPLLEGPNPPSLLNPAFIAEVTSESTADRDRGDKLSAYTKLERLVEYWIVEPTAPRVFRFFRDADLWHMCVIEGLDTSIESACFGVTVPMADLYRRISFEQTA